MKVGILGLGLIGGSLARAYSKAGHTVYARIRNKDMLSFAQLAGAVHGALDEETIPECDLILLAIYTDGCARWLESNAGLIAKTAMIIDCCGVKHAICERCFPLAENMDLLSLAVTRWQAPTILALSTAVPTCSRAHRWCWFHPVLTTRSFCNGQRMSLNPVSLVHFL